MADLEWAPGWVIADEDAYGDSYNVSLEVWRNGRYFAWAAPSSAVHMRYAEVSELQVVLLAAMPPEEAREWVLRRLDDKPE